MQHNRSTDHGFAAKMNNFVSRLCDRGVYLYQCTTNYQRRPITSAVSSVRFALLRDHFVGLRDDFVR